MRRSRAWRVVGWVLGLACLVGAAFALRDGWRQLGDLDALPGAGALGLAALCSFAGNAVLADSWRRVVALTGHRLEPGAAARAWATSQLARYAISSAQVFGRAAAARQHGLRLGSGIATTVVDIAWQSSLTGVLALATLPAWLPGDASLDWVVALAAVASAVLLAGVAFPDRYLRLVAWAVGFVRRRAAEAPPTVNRAESVGLTLRYAVNLALRVAVILVLANATGTLSWAQAGGAFAAAHLAGRAAVFAPGGVGAQEAVLALLLAPAIGDGPALAVAVVARLVDLVAELAFFGVARWWGRGSLAPDGHPADHEGEDDQHHQADGERAHGATGH